MKKNKWIWLLLSLLGVLFAVVGVPVIINECYKTGTGYLTFWGPTDVLSYYGTILGSVIAVATLIGTILFTRKQILRETFLYSEKEKWTKYEECVDRILEDINPITPTNKAADIINTRTHDTTLIFAAYQKVCLTCAGELSLKLPNPSIGKIQQLIDEITSASIKFISSAEAEKAAYALLCAYDNRDTFQKALDLEEQSPNTFDKSFIHTYHEVLEQVNEKTLDDIMAQIKAADKIATKLYFSEYRSLLKLKRETFDEIQKEVQAQANEILCFWRKK